MNLYRHIVGTAFNMAVLLYSKLAYKILNTGFLCIIMVYCLTKTFEEYKGYE